MADESPVGHLQNTHSSFSLPSNLDEKSQEGKKKMMKEGNRTGPQRLMDNMGHAMKSITATLTAATAAMLLSSASASAQEDTWSTDFSKRMVPLEELMAGGPPKDGIPAISRPKFETVKQAGKWLGKREPVAVVAMNGEAKAYPQQSETPVVVTFCPLCNTTLAFDRRFDGRVLDFGTTGYLRHSDLVMYDRQTETWWQQATGEGLIGEYAGSSLTFIGSPVVSWSEFKAQYPAGLVLSRDTGHPDYTDRYGRNPYVGYDAPGSSPWSFFSGKNDDRLPAKERVVAVELDDETRAYPFSSLSENRVVRDRIGDRHIVVFWAPGTASALDSVMIGSGRDVGATGVFERELDGERLNFEVYGERQFRDTETGSIWNVLGFATAGPLVGQRLNPINHGNHFWFAWAVFKPETKVVR
jgi:hypothetical protein